MLIRSSQYENARPCATTCLDKRASRKAVHKDHVRAQGRVGVWPTQNLPRFLVCVGVEYIWSIGPVVQYPTYVLKLHGVEFTLVRFDRGRCLYLRDLQERVDTTKKK